MANEVLKTQMQVNQSKNENPRSKRRKKQLKSQQININKYKKMEKDY